MPGGVKQPTILFLKRWNSSDGVKDFSIQKYRATIIDLVDNFLTDLDDVAQTLASSGRASLGSLNMCLEFIGENTEIFLQVSPQGIGLSDSQVSPEEKSSQAFCMWFLRHLIRLLSRPDCNELHEITIRLIIQILQDAKLRSKFFFRTFVQEFINTASDLIQACNLLYEGTEEIEIKHFEYEMDQVQLSLKNPASSQTEQEPSEISLKEIHIKLSDADHCELLQVNIVKILLKMFLDVCQFYSTHLEVLWECLTFHVQDGDLDLKLVSLEALSQLLDIVGPPPLKVREFFLSCVSGLWELLCSQPTPLDLSEKVQLEIAASKLLKCLIKRKTHPLFSFKQHFYRDFISRIVKKGLSNVHTKDGRQALGSMIVCLFTSLHSKDLHSQINRPVLDLVTLHLMNIVETEQHFELVTPVIVQLILLEAQQHSDSYFSSSKTLDATPAKTPIARKRRHPSTIPPSKMLLPTFTLLVDKLNMIPTTRPPSKEEMNCLNVIIRVATQCTFHLIGSKSRLPLINDSLIERALDCWKKYLASVDGKSDGKQEFLDNYHRIVYLLGCIAYGNDAYHLLGNIFHEFAWIVSLPWLLNDMSWKDLKPRNPKEVIDIATGLSSFFGDEATKCLCLKALTLIPKETATQWKSHVYTISMSDNSTATTKILIKHFPVVLQNTGPSNGHLISLLTPLLRKENGFELYLARAFGGMSLVLAQIGTLDRSTFMKLDLEDFDPKIVVNDEKDLKMLKDASKPVDLEWVSPFLRFLEHKNAEIRKAAGHSLSELLLCINVDTGTPFGKCLITHALNLLEDEDYRLRVEFSTIVSRLLTSNANNPLKKPAATDHMVLEFLKSLCMKAHRQNMVKLHETALMAVGQLGRVVEGQLLEECVICLLENRLNKQLLDAIALEELQGISLHKGEPLQHIYVRFKKMICKFLIEAMYTDQQTNDGINAKNIVINIANTLGFDDVKTFLQGNEKYLLPFLVSKATPDVTKLIKLLANLQFSNNVCIF